LSLKHAIRPKVHQGEDAPSGILYHSSMSDAASRSSAQLGLLDLSVDLSVPEVYSGGDFTLYLHVKNPFAQPVWIKSVELSLPTQLSVRQSVTSLADTSKEGRIDSEFIRDMIREREAEIRQLRQILRGDGLAADRKAEIRRQIDDLEYQIQQHVANLSGNLVVNASGESKVQVNKALASNFVVNLSGASEAQLNDYRGLDLKEPERIPLLGSLPYGSALQPGSTDVWTIRLGSRRTPFFIPAKYRLQLTVIYGLEKPPEAQEDHRNLYSNTSAFAMQVRAALWSVILGGFVGGIVGSVARSIQQTGMAAAFKGSNLSPTIGALILSAILSGAAVVFSARKTDAQSFVTVEDFWGGVLIGFLIGYSGTTAFGKITGSGL
jgi:hypothetical protein